jgi:Ca-activated chloride channel family protein
MKQILLILLVINFTWLNAMTKKVDMNMIDDWEYNATAPSSEARSNSANMGIKKQNFSNIMAAAPVPTPLPKSMGYKKLGMAVGGAKDTDNFKTNIENGYLPKLDSITYEGVFYGHYFDTGAEDQVCKSLFCPSYATAKRNNNFSKKEEYFLSVGLNSGIEEREFKRKKLNLVVVLDISGSMGARFNSYYYDKAGKKIENKDKTDKKKIEIANRSIVAMLSHLNDDDRVGVVLFDNEAYLAKPLRLVGLSDKKAIRDHILELQERGGTNWSAGYQKALSLFEGIKSSSEYENRIIFLTDAMPNRGELSKERLFGMAKGASSRGIHTTFVGIGVDFNTDLVEYISKIKGSNYFSVHSSLEFAKRLDKEFDYMVTPLVYDLVLKLDSKQYAIEAVYGSPDAKMATGEIMRVNTLFASSTQDGETKGGVVLLKLKKLQEGSDDIKLSVSYTNVEGKAFSSERHVQFKKQKESFYDNSGIHKAILLSDYVSVMKNWLMDSRAGCNDQIKWMLEPYPSIMKRCMVFPPKRPLYPLVKTWERSSCKLKVSEGYKKLFEVFREYYIQEMKQLQDKSLQEELSIIDKLLEQKATTLNREVIDDWKFKK